MTGQGGGSRGGTGRHGPPRPSTAIDAATTGVRPRARRLQRAPGPSAGPDGSERLSSHRTVAVADGASRRRVRVDPERIRDDGTALGLGRPGTAGAAAGGADRLDGLLQRLEGKEAGAAALTEDEAIVVKQEARLRMLRSARAHGWASDPTALAIRRDQGRRLKQAARDSRRRAREAEQASRELAGTAGDGPRFTGGGVVEMPSGAAGRLGTAPPSTRHRLRFDVVPGRAAGTSAARGGRASSLRQGRAAGGPPRAASTRRRGRPRRLRVADGAGGDAGAEPSPRGAAQQWHGGAAAGGVPDDRPAVVVSDSGLAAAAWGRPGLVSDPVQWEGAVGHRSSSAARSAAERARRQAEEAEARGERSGLVPVMGMTSSRGPAGTDPARAAALAATAASADDGLPWLAGSSSARDRLGFGRSEALSGAHLPPGEHAEPRYVRDRGTAGGAGGKVSVDTRMSQQDKARQRTEEALHGVPSVFAPSRPPPGAHGHAFRTPRAELALNSS